MGKGIVRAVSPISSERRRGNGNNSVAGVITQTAVKGERNAHNKVVAAAFERRGKALAINCFGYALRLHAFGRALQLFADRERVGVLVAEDTVPKIDPKATKRFTGLGKRMIEDATGEPPCGVQRVVSEATF